MITDWQRENFATIERMIANEPLSLIELSVGLNISLDSLRSWKKRGWFETIKIDRPYQRKHFGRPITSRLGFVHVIGIRWPAGEPIS